MDYKFFLELGIILIATKGLGIVAKKLGIPQVVGALIAGLLIGPVCFGWVKTSIPLKAMAEIGVVLLMFSAGLGTNVKEIKDNGIGSVVITLFGVIVPLGLGFVVAALFNGGFANMTKDMVLHNLFYGVILTATSVGITVETLKELGKLKGKVGTSIMSAAILDDIIGIIILSVVVGMKTGTVNPGVVVGKVALFFVCAAAFGVLGHFAFKFLAKKFPHNRRIPIFSLAVCFFFAWAAEELFGIADITGAYVAGILLSNIKSTQYVERKIDINSYMIFSPIFFASIGIGISFAGFTWAIVGFGAVFVIAGLAGKFVGCGLSAKACGYNTIDSCRVGLGMMARGEVALIVANKGLEAGLIEPAYLTAVVMLVILSSFMTPILLKLTYKGKYGGEEYLGKLDKDNLKTVVVDDKIDCASNEGEGLMEMSTETAVVDGIENTDK